MSWECCIMHFSHVLSMKNEENALKYSLQYVQQLISSIHIISQNSLKTSPANTPVPSKAFKKKFHFLAAIDLNF